MWSHLELAGRVNFFLGGGGGGGPLDLETFQPCRFKVQRQV